VSLARKLLLTFLLVSVLPLLGLGYVYNSRFENELRGSLVRSLGQIADKKVEQINAFIEQVRIDTLLLSRSRTVRDALAPYAGEQGASRPAATVDSDELIHYYAGHIDAAQLYDLLLISANGDVVFSVRREADFGRNLHDKHLRDTGLALGFRQALDSLSVQFTDFDHYKVSGGTPSAFIVAPVLEGGRVIGAIALQIDIQRFNRISTDRTGLGQSGETVLARLEPGGGSALFTSQLQRATEGPFIFRSPLDKVAVPMRHALNGERGAGVELDYSGTPVIAPGVICRSCAGAWW